MMRSSARILSFCAIFFALLVYLPSRSEAHPHIWIDAFVEVVFDRGQVTALRINWTFDPFFTAVAVADFDTDSNATLDKAEAAKLAANSAKNLKESGFFTHIWLDSDRLDIASLQNIDMRMEEGRLNFVFTVAMPRPIDPTKTALSISFYDPSYYIEINPDPDDPLRFSGGAAPCFAFVQPDPQRTIYFGLVRPTLMQLMCNIS
jgi:ABC-type uncharacterized transport system substrate-binding protein